MTNYVCGLMRANLHVVLVKKSHPEWQRGKLNLPGGVMLPDETPKTAIVREWKEETGMDTLENQWYPRLDWQGQTFRLTLLRFLPEPILQPSIKGTDDEPTAWYRLADVLIPEIYQPKMLMIPPLVADLHWLLNLALDSNILDIIQLRDRR